MNETWTDMKNSCIAALIKDYPTIESYIFDFKQKHKTQNDYRKNICLHCREAILEKDYFLFKIGNELVNVNFKLHEYCLDSLVTEQMEKC